MVGLRKRVSLASLSVVLVWYAILISPASGLAASGGSTGTSRKVASPVPLQFTPETVTFADVPAGETYTQLVRVRNVSDAALQIQEIVTPDANLAITGIFTPVVVAPGMSEVFSVAYRGRTGANPEGAIRIVTNAGATSLAVRATAVESQRELTASVASIDFGDIAVGSSGKTEVLLTNAGNRDVNISQVFVSGGDFGVSEMSAARLSPGQKISLGVEFLPRTTGRQAATLRVLADSGSPLVEIPVSAVAANASQSTIKLNWEGSQDGARAYVVYRSGDPSGPYLRISSQALASAEFVDGGLAAGHTYYYVVTSVGPDEVESEYSAPISATVPEA